MQGQRAEHDESLTRSRFLASGGAASLAFLGLHRGAGLFGAGDALAAQVAAAPRRVSTFVSRPDLRPPLLTIRQPPRGAGDGYLFIAPSSGPGQRGVLIFDDFGQTVWFHPTTPQTATAFRASTLHSKPVLTWWEGKYSVEGLGRGVYVIADTSYREIARIQAGGHRDGDLHEFLTTSDGTALVTKNEAVTRDLRAYGGSAGATLYGGVVQEITIPSGKVLFEWRSLDHVGLDESHVGPSESHFDYFHINSVDVDADGHLLVSARNTWAVYKVHRRTGRVLWRLGGRKSSFAMGKGTVTAWQHDARSHNGGQLISIFDNGAAPQVQTQSRAILVRLDLERMKATLERSHTHRPNRIVSKFMGNAQVLPDGGVVTGWGSEPFVTEFAPNGSIRFEATLPHGGQNYRAFRLPWHGTPFAPPRLTKGTTDGKQGLFVSWNGATDIAAWHLRYGPSPTDLHDGPTTKKTGFETHLGHPAAARWATAIPLDKKGKALGRFRPTRL